MEIKTFFFSKWNAEEKNSLTENVHIYKYGLQPY